MPAKGTAECWVVRTECVWAPQWAGWVSATWLADRMRACAFPARAHIQAPGAPGAPETSQMRLLAGVAEELGGKERRQRS